MGRTRSIVVDGARACIRRLIDGMVGKAAKRVEDTAAYTYGTDRNAAELCARLVGRRHR